MSKARKAPGRPGPASDARSVAGRRAQTTFGRAHVSITGTPSIREASAQPACSAGTKHSASPATAGRPIPIGTSSSARHPFEPVQLGVVRFALPPCSQVLPAPDGANRTFGGNRSIPEAHLFCGPPVRSVSSTMAIRFFSVNWRSYLASNSTGFSADRK
jgi:hypothetical protein